MTNKHNFKTYKLPNGFCLALQPTPSQTIFANLKINHGALHEKEGEEGIAHFLEHMLLEGGTSKYSPEEQARIRENFGYTNAYTSSAKTMIPWGMVYSDLEAYLDMASQMAFSPRLDKKVLEQQKKVVLSEISRAKGSPDFEDMRKFFIPSIARDRNHTYFVLGNEKIIKNITEEQLRAFHARGYSPNNMVLMLAGNLSSDTRSKVEKYFGSIPSGSGKEIDFSRVNPLEEKAIRYSSAPDLLNKKNPKESNSKISLGIVVPDEFHEDSAALNVTSEIFGNSWITGIRKRIRSEEGMSYDIGSYYSGDQKFGRFEVIGKVHSRKQEKALDIIFEELNKLKTNTPNNNEVESAKRRAAYEIANRLEPPFSGLVSVDSINVAEIGRMNYAFDKRVPIKERLRRVESVAPKDVQRVANLYLPSDRESGKYVLLVRDPLKN